MKKLKKCLRRSISLLVLSFLCMGNVMQIMAAEETSAAVPTEAAQTLEADEESTVVSESTPEEPTESVVADLNEQKDEVVNSTFLPAPSKIDVKNVSDYALELTWPFVAGASGYIVYRSEDNGATWDRLTSDWKNIYQDMSLTFGVEYLYKVQTILLENNVWVFGDTTGPVSGRMKLETPQNVQVFPGAGNHSVKLTWNQAGSAAIYGVMRSDSPDGPYTLQDVVFCDFKYTDSDLEIGKEYYYKIYASTFLDGIWYNGEMSAAVSGRVRNAPAQVKAECSSLTSISLGWEAIPGAAGYLIFRSDKAGGPWQTVTSTWMNVCTDTGLEPYKEYYYYVQTLDFVDGFWGYGADSQIVSAKTGLAVPGNVTVAADGANYYGMRIRWDVTQGATFYGIMRAVSGTGNFEWIGMTYALDYLDMSVTPGESYDYKVYATNFIDGQWFNGEMSSPVSGRARSESDGPVISNVTVVDVSGRGYTVVCNVASSSPITQVIFPSWTDKNGQDDIVWSAGYVSGNTAIFQVWTKDHNYEIGKYLTCIYAYDSTGKMTGVSCEVNVPVFSKGSGTGWYDTDGENGERYYLLNGTAVTGWQYVGGLKYYFYSNGALCQDVDNLIGVQSNYVIKVNKQMNCVTIYASDGAHGYVIPVKSMLCSTGDDTPLGTFYTPQKYRWKAMFNGTWAQFATRLTAGEGFLFHSITYETTNNRTLLTDGYNGLGVTRSAGCIRLLCKNAYWIYSRCSLGTKVIVYNSSTSGPFYRPVLVPIPSTQRYDPTDPFL